MALKDLNEDDRPREKFLLKGKNSLSDAELLAIVLGSGNRDQTAVELSRDILKSVGNNWHNLSLLSVADLIRFRGMGEAKAIAVITALEIGRRRASQAIPERPVVSGSKDAFNILHPHMADLNVEQFWALFLNQKNKVLHVSVMTEGGISSSVVDIRILFKAAMERHSTSIIVAHNHPSGNLKPSQEDLKITKQIAAAGDILNIKLLDHLIITQNSYLSFADEQLL